jgi:folate-dependent phosphoribosylglycinamide formyltransferase PurN
MHVVVFGSGSGTNLEALLGVQKQSPNPKFQIKALFTDRQSRFLEIGKRECIPVIYHSFVKFFKDKGLENYQDPIVRHQYDQEAVNLLNQCAKSFAFRIDLIVLAGYMRLLTPALLDAFPNKFINVHPADLSVLDEQGKRRYVGADAVYDALKQGERQTRSSVILVSLEVDAGPVLVEGPWVQYSEGFPVTQDKARRHQEKQKALSDWPACVQAVQLIAEGKLDLNPITESMACVEYLEL